MGRTENGQHHLIRTLRISQWIDLTALHGFNTDACQPWGYGIKWAPRQLRKKYIVNHSDPNAGTWTYLHVQTLAHTHRHSSVDEDASSLFISIADSHLVQNERAQNKHRQ